MSSGLLTAGSGQRWENELVAALDRPGAPLTVIRRCVDIADVLAEAATGTVVVVVVSADLRRLDTEAVRRLTVGGVAVVAVYAGGDTRAPLRLERIGIDVTVADDAGVDVLLAAARAAALDRPSATGNRSGGNGSGGNGSGRVDSALADPRAALSRPPDDADDTDVSFPPPDAGAGPDGSPVRGRVVAVWGPTGAPGRSTVAAGLAVAAARAGHATLLVDADVHGGILASAFGLLDESAGLAGACRMAANGRLDTAALAGLAWAAGDDLRLLTGISRADRWPELRPSAVPGVLAVARSMAPLVVVDLAFALETDEEITFDSVAPRRNGATLAALADADIVLAVGSADPPGMERLVRGLAELREMMPEVRPQVVLNRCRRTAASPAEAAQALHRFTALKPIETLDEDRGAVDRAWRDGRPLAEIAPASSLTRGLGRLAASVLALAASVEPTSSTDLLGVAGR